ncbi:hypothetical protein CDLVIII_5554 [Clostridium sp. DL-VIII]|uniref:SPOR domain-containing protein n=1 Tax=Clostridium sp. DL-VIII TaxID=641107 RepID=UPI00023B05F3|nr:SPOR domain-containing protein [Clostridium sp. DL-VIII]EHJ02028.1 hypothetical protein CDLVIII_5554 [Clostridium sp. DL-VIII]
MRYTRYEYKKSSKVKFLFSVVVIVGISISGGLYASNVIFRGKEMHDISSSSNSGYSNELPEIIVLQCGYYSKEENAKESLTALAKYCEPFIVEDDGMYRVLAGMYNEDDGLKKMQEFKSNNIDVTKINLNIPDDSSENKKIVEIVNGFLTIINKLQDNEVKSIKTTEFKAWTDKIIKDGDNNSKKINDLGNYVENLPDEINKSNSNTNIQELYKLIKN